MASQEVKLNSSTHQLTLTGIAAGTPSPRAPLVVAIHGGASTAAYFDIPGHSLLDLAAAIGFRALAINRPGYASSNPLPGDTTAYEEQATVRADVIGEFWRLSGETAAGVVVLAHSIGSAIAIHLAARQLSWPLLGIAIHGIGLISPAPVIAAWESRRGENQVSIEADMRRELVFGPAGTYDEEVVEQSEETAAPAPTGELLEVVGGWPDDARRLGPQVRVPVHYRLAEHETLWESGQGRIDEFAGLFTAAPFVDAREVSATGHCIDHHHVGRTLHLEQLAFASRCTD